MADQDTRVPDDLDEGSSAELDPAAYHGSVPSSLTGFRGINQPTLIIGVAIGLVIVVFTIVSIIGRFHAGASPSTASIASRATAGPAAGGINGNPNPDASPFIPEPSPFPTELETTAPFSFGSPRPVQTPYSPGSTPTPIAYHPAGPNTAPARMNGNPSTASVADSGSGKMSLEPPTTQTGSQDAQAVGDLNDPNARFVFRPVYDHGRLVMVVPVPIAPQRGRTVPAMQSRYQYQPGGPPSSQQVAQAYDDQYGQQQYGGPSQYGGQSVAPADTPAPSGQFVSSDTADSGVSGDAASQAANSQQHFVKEHGTDDVGYVPSVSVDQIDPTTIIPARLLSKIVSTLPGPVAAQVIAPVYDSSTHSTIVIPAGTKLFGTYDSAVIENQNRLLMAWQRLVFPDGHEFVIGGQPATDAQGAAGINGDTDYHRGSLYTSAFLITVLAGAEAAIGAGSTQTCSSGFITGQTPTQAVQCSTGTQISSLANKIFDKNLSRQPTIIIRPPYEFQIFVTRDLPLDKYLVR